MFLLNDPDLGFSPMHRRFLYKHLHSHRVVNVFHFLQPFLFSLYKWYRNLRSETGNER